jgi:hypothetical protein
MPWKWNLQPNREAAKTLLDFSAVRATVNEVRSLSTNHPSVIPSMIPSMIPSLIPSLILLTTVFETVHETVLDIIHDSVL